MEVFKCETAETSIRFNNHAKTNTAIYEWTWLPVSLFGIHRLDPSLEDVMEDVFHISKPKRWRVTTLIAALSVRALLVLHNILAVWRVVISRKDNRYWALTSTNILMFIEAFLVVMKNGGNEWKW